jgi:soluble lytic murein transglycosylase-like protein
VVVVGGVRRFAGVVAVLGALSVALVGCSGGSAQPGAAAPGASADGCGAPTDAAALACRLRSGDAVVHDPAATPTALADAGRRTQDAYRRLGDHPEWDAAVLPALGPALGAQAQHAVAAYRALISLDGRPSTTLPAWKVVDPIPADVLRGYYDEAQRRYGVSWTVLAAVNLVETRMGRVVGLSTAGAQGPMQFMPPTWAAYGLGGDVWNPRDAILGAAHYLAANGGADPARLDRALRRYNNDVRYVSAVRDYAAMMAADPRAFIGLHAWPVEYRTVAGDIPLDPGYASTTRIPVAEWLASHPEVPGAR